jgi:hypothetical protein
MFACRAGIAGNREIQKKRKNILKMVKEEFKSCSENFLYFTVQEEII